MTPANTSTTKPLKRSPSPLTSLEVVGEVGWTAAMANDRARKGGGALGEGTPLRVFFTKQIGTKNTAVAALLVFCLSKLDLSVRLSTHAKFSDDSRASPTTRHGKRKSTAKAAKKSRASTCATPKQPCSLTTPRNAAAVQRSANTVSLQQYCCVSPRHAHAPVCVGVSVRYANRSAGVASSQEPLLHHDTDVPRLGCRFTVPR